MWKDNLTITLFTQPIPPRPSALNYLESKTNPELSQWYHATIFSPVHQNHLQAISKGYFYRWNNLILDLIKNLPQFMATKKINIKQTRNKIHSERTPETTPSEEATMDKLETRSNQVFTKIINPKQNIVTELTGNLPITYNRGKNICLYYMNKTEIESLCYP